MTFLEKYELLKKSVPVPAVSIDSYTINCEYVDNVYRSKNSYYCFNCNFLEDSIYTSIGRGTKLVDCVCVIESEKCYNCVSCTKCYNSTYLIDCHNSTDCHFSAFLNTCSDSFGCVSLTHKKYCIYNKQYSKEEYFKKVEELKKDNPEKSLNKMLELKDKIPHPASQQFNSENCPYGDYIFNSKNVYWSFIYCSDCENSGYGYMMGFAKNCWDVCFFGGNRSKKTAAELCYEMVDTLGAYNCAFLVNCGDCVNCYYSSYLRNCSDCFGCVGLANKKYCILNNQLTKIQYEKAIKEIKRELGWKY